MTKTEITNALRKTYLDLISASLSADNEVLVVGSNEIAIPCVDSEGNDSWVTVTVKVPKGSRDGDEYDGYALAEAYQMHLDEKAEKAKVQAEKKAKKIAEDKARREAKKTEKGA